MTEAKTQKNRGYSLIELIVALAIAAVVAIIVGSVMVSSANTYSRANAETSVQTRAQIVMNQINDLVIDTTGKVEYLDGTDKRTLRLFNDEKVYDVEWASGAGDEPGELIYKEYDTDDGETIKNADSPKSDTLSEGVESFLCDLSALSSNRIVGVDLVLKKGQRRYHAYKNISIRNPLLTAGESISGDTGSSLSENKVVLKVTNNVMTVEPGGTYTLYGARVDIKSGNPSTEVIYEVVKSSVTFKNDTKVSETDHKTLKVHPSEDKKIISVKVYPAADPDQFQYIAVYNRRVNRVDSLTASSSTGDYKPGSVVTVTAQLDVNEGYNDSTSDREKLYALNWTNIWKIDPDNGYHYQITNNAAQMPEIKPGTGTSFSFKIPDNVKNDTVYEFELQWGHVKHAQKNGGLSGRGSNTYNGVNNYTQYVSFTVTGGAMGDYPVIVDTNKTVYRGQKKLQLSGNSLPKNTAEVYFFYRQKEHRRIDKASFERVDSYTNNYNNETKANIVWDAVTQDKFNSLSSYGWVAIEGADYNGSSFKIPEAIFKIPPINEDYRFQLLMLKKNADANTYSLCGRGEFVIPGFRLKINDERKKVFSYKVFQLASENSLPVKNGEFIKVGQEQRAFAKVVIDNEDNDPGEYDGKLEVYTNDYENKTLAKAEKLDKSDYKLITKDDNVMDTYFRVDNLSKKGYFKYPLSSNGGWDKYNYYRIHIAHSWPKRDADRYMFESKINDDTKIYDLSSGSYIELQMRRGNAKVSYRRWKDLEDPDNRRLDNWNDFTNYNDRAAYIPPPGSDEDLLNQYSLKLMNTTWRPAGKMQPVYINTFMEDWYTQKKEPYLIQMKVDDGKRYLRMWYADPLSVKTNLDGSFTANKWFYVGEYVYNSDSQMWDYRNNREPTTY